jgi:hypothetical protein
MRTHEALLKSEGFAKRPLAEQIEISRRAMATKLLTIYRTDANPAFCDLSIDPWTRKVGSLLGVPRSHELPGRRVRRRDDTGSLAVNMVGALLARLCTR